MNTVIENLKIRLQNAINQIDHLERLRLIDGKGSMSQGRLSTSDIVISDLQKSLTDLETETEGDDLNRFSMDREQINGQTEFEIQETLLNGLGADRQREQWENHR